MHTRETAAIALTPTGNDQGGYWFLSLVTGARLSRKQWDILPMPQNIIARVEQMALEQHQPLMVSGMPIFEWAPGEAIIDRIDDNIDFNDDDNLHPDLAQNKINDEYIPPFDHADHLNPDDDTHDDNALHIDDADNNTHDDEAPDYSNSADDDDAHNTTDNDIFVKDVSDDDDSEHNDHNNGIFVEDADDDDINDNKNNNHTDLFEDAEELFPTTPPVSNDDDAEQRSNNTETKAATDGPAFNTRKGTRDYAHRFANKMDNPASSKSYDARTQFLQTAIDDLRTQLLQKALDDFNDTGSTLKMNRYITGFMMNQMTATKGIKKHGQLAIDALMAEFQQLHDMNVFEGMDPTLLTA